MKKPPVKKVAQLLCLLLFCINVSSQQSLKSILINHGAPSCGNTTAEEQLITGTVSGSPTMIQACNAGLPFFNAFVAYNPIDKRLYAMDINTAGITNVYPLDFNFNGVISCPAPAPPAFTYNYHIQQLCFDENGDNLSMYNYDGISQGRIKRIDLTTGNDIPGTDRPLDFPIGNTPNTFGIADLVILPNGRVFATVGGSPSRLYELTNINGPGNATAVYLVTIPRRCFSIGYVDGSLIVGGYDGSGCYYYIWDINSNALSTERVFPLGKTTIDMSHLNVGAGVAQALIGGTMVNGNTADIIYQVHLKNKGNTDLANIQLQNRLTDAFGAGNVSNVNISFASNPAALLLNPGYDGVTDINLLAPGQILPNYPIANDSLVITIQLRATNLVMNQVYLSSAIGSGQTGSGANLLAVTDSSNNGPAPRIDPDLNGVSDDANEGIPTPFMINIILPSNNLGFTGSRQQNTVQLTWNNSHEVNVAHYEIQRSTDGRNYLTMATIPARRKSDNAYAAADNIATVQSPLLYYRLKWMENNMDYYSNIIPVKLNEEKNNLSMMPNPFVDYVNLKINTRQPNTLQVTIYDSEGRTVKRQQNSLQPGINYIIVGGLQSLSNGVYILETIHGSEKTHSRLVK